MENAVDSIVVFSDQIVAGDIKDDKSLELFQVNNFFNFVNKVITEIKLHQGLKILEARKLGDLVVL